MEITLQQIHLIMQRANVSYSEAKAALEQANGDILEALLLLEQSHESVNKASQIAAQAPQPIQASLLTLTFIIKSSSS